MKSSSETRCLSFMREGRNGLATPIQTGSMSERAVDTSSGIERGERELRINTASL